MKTLVCIEKIGGISGKRIYVRLVSHIIHSFQLRFNVYSPKKSNTLFIKSSLLEGVLKILNNNKDLIRQEFSHEEGCGYVKTEAIKGYLLAEIEYKDGKIIEIKPISLTEGIKYLNEERGKNG